MNMCMHKIAETRCLNKDFKLEFTNMNIYHAQVQLFNIHSYNHVSCTAELIMHSFKHSFNMFNLIINRKYSCRSKMHKITYLMKKSFRN